MTYRWRLATLTKIFLRLRICTNSYEPALASNLICENEERERERENGRHANSCAAPLAERLLKRLFVRPVIVFHGCEKTFFRVARDFEPILNRALSSRRSSLF